MPTIRTPAQLRYDRIHRMLQKAQARHAEVTEKLRLARLAAQAHMPPETRRPAQAQVAVLAVLLERIERRWARLRCEYDAAWRAVWDAEPGLVDESPGRAAMLHQDRAEASLTWFYAELGRLREQRR